MMLGLGVTKGSLAGSDITPPPQKVVVYESDFSTDTDGWVGEFGISTWSAPETSPGGMTDAFLYSPDFQVTGGKVMLLDLSSYTVPSGSVTYHIEWTIENTGGDKSTNAGLTGGSVDGFSPTTSANQNQQVEVATTVTATEPTSFTIRWSDASDGSVVGDTYVKDILLYYYS